MFWHLLRDYRRFNGDIDKGRANLVSFQEFNMVNE